MSTFDEDVELEAEIDEQHSVNVMNRRRSFERRLDELEGTNYADDE